MLERAEKYADAIMPGYTHLQRAQPMTFAHHMMAYANMLQARRIPPAGLLRAHGRNAARLAAHWRRTTYPIDRDFVS